MSQANRHLRMLVPEADWKMLSRRRAASVWAGWLCGALGGLSPGLLAKGSHREVCEGRSLTSPALTVVSLEGLRQNPHPDVTPVALALLQCHLTYLENEKKTVLILSYYLIHARFVPDLLAFTLEMIYFVALPDLILEIYRVDQWGAWKHVALALHLQLCHHCAAASQSRTLHPASVTQRRLGADWWFKCGSYYVHCLGKTVIEESTNKRLGTHTRAERCLVCPSACFAAGSGEVCVWGSHEPALLAGGTGCFVTWCLEQHPGAVVMRLCSRECASPLAVLDLP